MCPDPAAFDSGPAHLTPEELLEHFEWIQGLARRLVDDPYMADDLSQEAWLAALRSPAPTGGALRAWLAKLLRNLARKIVRSEGRRRLHEAEAGISVFRRRQARELLEHAIEGGWLVNRVLALGAPYRDTLLARYYRGLSPDEIAERDGLSVATVKTRLRRGLELLRHDVRDRQRGRARGVLLSAPAWRRQRDVVPSSPFGRWLRLRTATWGLLSLASLTVLVRVLSVGDGSEVPNGVGAPLLARDGTSGAAPGLTPAGPVSRARAVAAQPVPEPAQPVATPRQSLHGLVLDSQGQAVPGLLLGFGPDPETLVSAGRSDARGRFRLDVDDTYGVVACMDERFAGVLHAVVFSGYEDGQLLIGVAPGRVIEGRVLDSSGGGVPDARVRLSDCGDPRTEAGRIVDQSLATVRRRRSDGDGFFRFDRAAHGRSLRLEVTAAGFGSASLELHEHVDAAVPLTVVLPAPVTDVVVGVVETRSGTRLEGAWVTDGSTVALTDAEGLFQLPCPQGAAALDLCAVAEGYASTRRRLERRAPVAPGAPGALTARAGRPDRVTLVLEARALSIGGRVMDAGGAALAGAVVYCLDGEMFGTTWTESFGSRNFKPRWIQELASGRPGAIFPVEPDGSFLVEGLNDRSYELEALDPTTLNRVRVGSVPAGQRGVVLALCGQEQAWPLAGRVIGRDGQPLAGIQVSPAAMRRDGCPGSSNRPRFLGRAVHTDAQGRFSFDALRTEDLALLLRGGPAFFPHYFPVSSEGDRDRAGLTELVLIYQRQMHLEVEVQDSIEADSVGVLDWRGDVRLLSQRTGLSYYRRERWPLRQGASGVVSVEEGVRWLLLFRGEQEVARQPLSLVPGQIERLSF